MISIRLLIKSILIILALGLCETITLMEKFAYAQENPRLDIVLFRYYRFKTGEEHVIKHIIDQKIKNIVEELNNRSPSFIYLNKLRLKAYSDEAPSEKDNRSSLWKNTLSLELLWGTVYTKDGKNVVLTNMHIGDLRGNLKNAEITVELTLTPEEYLNFRDSHSLVTLYALAMDAKRLKYPNGVVTEYLSKAYLIAQDLITKGMDSNFPVIRSIKKAIEEELKELRKSNE